MTCTCGRINIGMQKTEHRNWNPDCEEHGTESEWYNSDEQRRTRFIASEALRHAQEKARIARRMDRE